MVWSWPCTVNFHEASAYANWKSKVTGKKLRLMTEPEHHAIRDVRVKTSGSYMHDPVMFNDESSKSVIGNANLKHSSPAPVNAYPPNQKGFFDVSGNSWEWCLDYFCPFPGFQVHHLYEDFSTPCFDGLHHVIMSSSFISTGNEVSDYSRFHFRPHFLQHASFRLVEGKSETVVTSDTDSPGPYVGQYPFRRSADGSRRAAVDARSAKANIDISRFYGQIAPTTGTSLLDLPTAAVPLNNNDMSSSLRDIILANSSHLNPKEANVIEVGCGGGGLTIELSKVFRSVMGIDHNHDFITMAKTLLRGDSLEYNLVQEGDLKETFSVTSAANTSVAADTKSSIVSFRTADPMCLPAELKDFDIVLLNDIIDKVSSPNSVLGRLGGVRGLVKKDGMLVIVSCFHWSETVTPRSLWLGGYTGPDGQKVSSVDTIKERLKDDFKLITRSDVPVFWKESIRDIRGKIFDVSVWKRNEV